ncbi:hypothetical protein F2Q70_00033365 [Brassica cretica]|uniref:Proteasome endopeptidase complex n=1 Tax=Brassica cretica TaxID=69181 RepID=A0A8S9FF28_BRACR|nr:hypothetical protein F2Q70_00033365 [Brassica cretica]
MMDLNLDAPHSMGTTIIGVTYNGGVVLGADSRTSTGEMRFPLFFTLLGCTLRIELPTRSQQLTDNVYVCRSGSAADSQVVSDYVRYFLHQHTIQLGQPATVKVSANLIRMLAYNNKINSEGVTRNFYPGDKLQLWHEELEPQNSLLDILNAAGPEPMAI